MGWLEAVESAEGGSNGTWVRLANNKDSVPLMILDERPAECTKQATKYGTEETYTKRVWVSHVVNMNTNEVQLWEVGPKLIKLIGPDLDGVNVSESTFTLTRYGAKNDQTTTYKIRKTGALSTVDRTNYEHAQESRKDLAALGYVVIKPAIPATAVPF